MRTLASIAAFALALFSAGAAAQSKWDVPTPYIDNEFHTQSLRQLGEEVKKATGGKLELVVHSGNSLIKHPDILRAVSTGQVNMGEVLLGQFGNEDPVFAADNIPFVAVGYEQAFKFYQAQKPVLEKVLQKRGIRLLYSVAWPGQGIYTKAPLKSLDDFKGIKFRTYSPQTARLAELLGASPTVIQAAEIPQAFATNTVQAMITSSATGVTQKSWEFVKAYYTTSAFHPKNVVIVNERAFQRLPEDQRKALLTASAVAEKRGWQLSAEREKSGNETLAKNGVAVIEPDAAMKAAMAKIGDTILAEWSKTASAEGEAIIKAYRSK
ncbi:MAG: TRAP transporter substrate-binding protein [Betaproteobacteria bacterium]|nr:TRAP transporter substrate-binding protein [Betaproteobacteria bacterium]